MSGNVASMAYEQIIAATIDGRWMPTPGDPRDLGRLVLEVPEDGVGRRPVNIHLGHDVERDVVPVPDARFDVARGLGLLVAEPVWKSTSELGYPEKYCVDLREPPRHRADTVTGKESHRWRGIATPSLKHSYGSTSRRRRGAPEI